MARTKGTVIDAAQALVTAGRTLYQQNRTAPAWKDLTPESQDLWISRASAVINAFTDSFKTPASLDDDQPD